MEEAAQRERRRRRLWVALALAGAIGLVLAAIWAGRGWIASDVVDRRLAAAGVPARYRLTAMGPVTQVIEDVRLGDPVHPDLIARRIRLDWRYGLAGPRLAAVAADGVRVTARWRDGRLSLGALDRLLPRTGGGGPVLPDLAVTLHDARLTLLTPAGDAAAAIDGAGNLARDFHGRITLTAARLALQGCGVQDVRASLQVAVADRRPRFVGPIGVGDIACAQEGLRLAHGGAGIDLRPTPDFAGAEGRVALAGFAGRHPQATFAGLHAALTLAYGARQVAGHATVTLADVATRHGRATSATAAGAYRIASARRTFAGDIALNGATAPPPLLASIRAAAASASSTPLAPLAARLGAAAGAIAAGSDVAARVQLDDGPRRTLLLDRATVRTQAGLTAVAKGAFADDGTAWHAVGDIAGARLPTLRLRAAQATPGGPMQVTADLAPYRAGAASLAATPVRITIARTGTRFATIATISGPLGSGSIEGLVVPVAGTIDRTGTLRLAEGCNALRFHHVALAGMMLDPGGVTICGAPVLRRLPTGAIQVAAVARDIALTGRSGTAPLALRAATLRFSTRGFAGDGIAVTLGAADDPTRLALAGIAGRFGTALTGEFAGAAGSIGHVPLALSGGTGTWEVARGALRLKGALEIRDRAEAPRFAPMAAGDVALALADGVIDARAGLRPLGRQEQVATVALRHDLTHGAGGADIAVAALTFVRKRLQPEMLTPLTLGVVANVAGTIDGAGRIDWSPQGVTSSGAFHTDRLDLAAAFGPVTGLAGTIRFADLLGLVTAPHQEVRIAAINPGILVGDGIAHYQLIGGNRVQVEDARWPFAGGELILDPTTLDFAQAAERRLSFRIAGLDAAAFVQQLDFPNVAATGTFDGRLPMIFDASGGRIEAGSLTSRGIGTVAYVGELSNAALGTMGKLAFDALKSIRYSGLDITLGGRLDGEIVTRVRFEGVRQATGDKGLVARMIRNLPFRFNIAIRAPFQGLVGSARAYADPRLLLQQIRPIPPAAIQPADSTVRR